MHKLANARLDFVSELIRTEQLAQRLLNETANIARQMSLLERLAKHGSDFKGLWNYEIIQIDNNSVTTRKAIFSLLILIVGIIVVKYLIRTFTGRLFRYANLKDTTAAGIQKVLLFSAYLLVFLFALRMVNIPLAAFAFLGGAVAIGVGFGAQNLINNFISGFIIMGERPISIGNLIEVDGVLGQVEEVGARCTRVRTGENIHILVPNSSFLEKNITNWTLSDQNIRTHITVGVIYGSPVRQVEELLLQAARENPLVIKPPEPFVIFQDFGDNALIFEVYFWISIKRVIERRIIESNIRFQIDKIFGEANIVIAFPQRDVHLDTQKPLELRILESERQTPSPLHTPSSKE
jgi:small-conductance mechanosensitive channel